MGKKAPALYLNVDNRHLVTPLPDKSAGKLFKAILEYAYDDTVNELPDVDGIRGIFNLMKEQIDRNNAHYADVTKKRSEAGKKGGAPKGNQNARKQSVYNTDGASFDLKKYESESLFDD